jgi:hypothetical protein
VALAIHSVYHFHALDQEVEGELVDIVRKGGVVAVIRDFERIISVSSIPLVKWQGIKEAAARKPKQLRSASSLTQGLAGARGGVWARIASVSCSSSSIAVQPFAPDGVSPHKHVSNDNPYLTLRIAEEDAMDAEETKCDRVRHGEDRGERA